MNREENDPVRMVARRQCTAAWDLTKGTVQKNDVVPNLHEARSQQRR